MTWWSSMTSHKFNCDKDLSWSLVSHVYMYTPRGRSTPPLKGTVCVVNFFNYGTMYFSWGLYIVFNHQIKSDKVLHIYFAESKEVYDTPFPISWAYNNVHVMCSFFSFKRWHQDTIPIHAFNCKSSLVQRLLYDMNFFKLCTFQALTER